MPIHPRLDNLGQKVPIGHPHQPSPLSAWKDSCRMATVVPDGPMPYRLNHVLFRPWEQAPADFSGWQAMDLEQECLAELEYPDPPFEAKGRQAAAGAVVVEPDGRVWLVAPTNGFGGAERTFPKGHANRLDLRTTAVKEVYEESGLRVKLMSHLIDVTRSTTRTRYYLARRIGGTPAAMGWESQAVFLAPAEDLKTLLTKAVDHKVVDALLERLGEWAGWFRPKPAADLAEVERGLAPARHVHWNTMPMPRSRTTLPLAFHLTRNEAARVRLGFVPSAMEEKWFAYMEGDTLFEHRSWTGFCITQVHFVPDGDGLRATHAEVNRWPHQWSNQDDEEERENLTSRVKGLARMTFDSPREDGFVTALKASMVPNYLGSPKVVGELLAPFFQAVIDQHIALHHPGDGGPKGTYQAVIEASNLVANAFAGEDPTYTLIGTWNTAGSLGAAAIKGLDLDPDYYADENLFCILSEGLAGVSMKVKEILQTYDLDPTGQLKRDLLPCLAGVRDFVASVLMGTQCVAYPDKTLKDFTYTQSQED